MYYMFIRRFIGVLVIICGIVSGILLFQSSSKASELGNIFLTSGANGLFSKNTNVTYMADIINLLLKGLAVGIFGICLALGAMVFKIGSGKESISINLKEDKIEAALKYDKSTKSELESRNNYQENNVRNESRIEENGIGKEKNLTANTGVHISKRTLIIAVSILLLLLNALFFVLYLIKK